jgi:hypothetical protein
MGGTHHGVITLQDVLDRYEAKRQVAPDVTPHDVTIESYDDGDDGSTGLRVMFASPESRAAGRERRAALADRVAFWARVPEGYRSGGAHHRPGAPGVEAHVLPPETPAHGMSYQAAICGTNLHPGWKRPEHRDLATICPRCRALIEGGADRGTGEA